ncbi:HAD family hydrolase [Veronia pacifica]|uniref:HAD family hydrolase n=1 Tax=Veronia pacifica TaxID=1080227 RepID=A0A1C3EM47_9GAMM|nr:HAD-IA family hydrolase [Veronia pacifica]ODA34299.1 HAD family hydrolase [Veronia pacifica]
MQDISSVLFDLDGTLLDTAPDMGFAVNEVLKAHGKETLTDKQVRQCANFGSRGLLSDGFGGDIPEAMIPVLRQAFFRVYSENICNGTDFYSGVAELLIGLSDKQIPWGIVTNKPGVLTSLLLPHFPLLSEAQVLVTPDTLNKAKPDPAPLLHAANQLGLAPERCLYVGDVRNDVIAAQRANMFSAVAAWGYRRECDHPSDWEPDQIFNNPTQILSLF